MNTYNLLVAITGGTVILALLNVAHSVRQQMRIWRLERSLVEIGRQRNALMCASNTLLEQMEELKVTNKILSRRLAQDCAHRDSLMEANFELAKAAAASAEKNNVILRSRALDRAIVLN